jgi:molecular chaperone DnaK (HSP70)
VAFSIRDTEAEEKHMVTVSEITTRHIKRLAESASDYLGERVDAAVITVPTNFSAAQKSALSEAAQKGGVQVLQFINEPVAAVLAYDGRAALTGTEVSDKNLVVADIGGTRSDVAIIASRGGIYTILATSHDYDVSGAQLDKALADYFAKEFLKKHKSAEDPRENPRSLAKLTMESEACKKALSLGSSASFSVESLSSGIDYTATINRTRYELLGAKTFSAITRLVLGAVSKAGLDPMDIDEIILSGGSSHTPRIAKNMQAAFPEHVAVSAPATRPDAISPSELAARGAAMQASLIVDFDIADIRESSHAVVTATPHLSAALGVLCISSDSPPGVFTPLIDTNTPAPVRRSQTFSVPGAGGDVIIKLCEATSEVVSRPAENKPNSPADDEGDGEGDDDDESDEEEEVREKKWAVQKIVAEAALRGVSKGGKVEVQLNIGPDLAITMVAREVGGKGGVRGLVKPY